LLYLTGAKNKVICADLESGMMGLLQTPATAYQLGGVQTWAMDNGCFTEKYPGDDAYLATLDKYDEHRDRCLFVAAPDVVGDGPATLALFPTMAARIKQRGWPVALVAQDGMTPDQIPWRDVDWLFVGGSTEWKMGLAAARLITAAVDRGVKVHAGRVNSAKRFAYFAALGCDTADGTFLAFGPEQNAPQIRAWMRQPIQEILT